MSSWIRDWWQNKRDVVTHSVYAVQGVNLIYFITTILGMGETVGDTEFGLSFQFFIFWTCSMSIFVGAIAIFILRKYRSHIAMGFLLGATLMTACLLVGNTALFSGLAAFLSAIGSTDDARTTFNTMAIFSFFLAILFVFIFVLIYFYYENLCVKTGRMRGGRQEMLDGGNGNGSAPQMGGMGMGGSDHQMQQRKTEAGKFFLFTFFFEVNILFAI
eukprot:TRINITY_DN77195_c0_g1_i2.p1 TRINITY_DN77195_c0_g1~~TRINITY_DN77195_c0_g1_i2.p1  ORF type:complete len:216 (-),score=42.26 TRINITY_DN77195_c0_g1_i2:1008-1655(-)